MMQTKNFQTSKLGFKKEKEPEIKLLTSAGSQRKQGNSRKTSTSVSSSTLKPLTVWIGRRNINNLSYMDDINLMAESKEELKSTLMKVKEESEKLA